MGQYSRRAAELFGQGYNCAQAVVAAFCEELGVDTETAMKISASFGGGMGGLHEVCGAVSGMFMVVGIKYGSTLPKDRANRVELDKRIQALAEAFRAEHQSIICRELLERRKTGGSDEAGKTLRQKRTCADMVEYAAGMVEEMIRQSEAEKE